ncbi:hypothetical protein [Bacillus sp. EB600]|uniref:hypothetical protein n=1 Tax=Bacillus sp. EB600 TaxID=2806345 RepID=UPI002109A00C|nr:hypothetical protein [Bacillus sp. EB600]MCQ6282505.1 hypothetical protein [Bacillus sp. EB600]
MDEMVTKGIMKISFFPENQVEWLLEESGFTIKTRFFPPDFLGMDVPFRMIICGQFTTNKC